VRHVKHDFVANYKAVHEDGKKDLLLDELSKATLLYPKAIADVLDSCGIYYKSLAPYDLMRAVKYNCDDLRMMNRVVRIGILVNKDGTQTYDGHSREMSHRHLMRKGSDFLKNNKDLLQDAVLRSKEAVMELPDSKILAKRLNVYLHMDGSAPDSEYSDEDDDDTGEEASKPSEPIKPKGFQLGTTQIFVIVGAVALLIYFSTRNKQG